jgi:hypothetical protein
MDKQTKHLFEQIGKETIEFKHPNIHGCIVDKNGDSFTFWYDSDPYFSPNKYFLPYQSDEGKMGISLTQANLWIIPYDEGVYIFRKDTLLESIMMQEWKTHEQHGIQYFIIPAKWLEEKAVVYKYE